MKRSRFFSLIIALVMCITYILPSSALISNAVDTSYKAWKQSDSRWGSLSIGGGDTMASAGCLITSCAILMVQSGAKPNDVSLFNPGTFATQLINDGYLISGAMAKGLPQSYSPDFYYEVNNHTAVLPDSYSVIYQKILNWLNQGYYVIVGVKWNGSINGHWVAVDYCANGEVYIMDPGYTGRDTLRYYDGTISGIKLIRANNLYNKEDYTPSKPTLSITPGTTTQPTTFSWAACTNANRYDVRIYQSGSDEVMIYQETTGTSTTVQLPQGSYYANVAATNTDANTYQFSDNVSFDVGLGVCEPTAITSYNGHIYALYENKTYYDQAVTLCQSMGGHLATITSAEENAAVTSLLANTGEYSEYWMGASDVANEGTWVWHTAEPFAYNNWRAGEPNDYNKVEHYLTIYRDGTWNDARSMKENNFGFIIEIEPKTPSAIEEYNNHVYYRFDSGLNWTEADAYSKTLGGHLVTISDQAENDFLTEFIADGAKERYWIGLSDSSKNNKYSWVTGENFTFDGWASGEPNNTSNIEHYAEIQTPNGGWNDIQNYTNGVNGLICEIEKTVTSVSIKSLPDKSTYYSGETLDLTGLSLLVKHQVGDDAVVTSGFTTSVDMNSLGEKSVTVTYAGKTTTFKINVICPKPTVTLQSKTDTSANITWTDISVATEYAVLLNGTEIARTTDTKYCFTNLNPVTAYEIRVAAYDGNGILETSDAVSVTTANSVTFDGEGTAENPYLITDYEDLKCLSDMINDKLTNPHFKNAYYQQTADIDMNHQEFASIGNGENSKSAVFSGNYNGNYHEITNLSVTGNAEYSGLFGEVGEALNTNDNCRIENLVVYGSVNSESKYAGGIAGKLSYNASIYGCAYYGDVSASETAGGIAGFIENGGIVDACYHSGTVSAANAGGVVGEITTEAQSGFEVYVVSSYHHNGAVNGTEHSGGVVGTATNNSGVLSLYNNYFEKTTAAGGIDGVSEEGAKAVNSTVLTVLAETLGAPYSDNSDAALNDGCPVFAWQLPMYQFAGKGTETSPYLIRNKQELLVLAEYLNDPTLNGVFRDNSYMQIADIDLSDVEWIPMASTQSTVFTGTYDGGYHKVINLNVTNDTMAGFLGRVLDGAIQNLVIENGTIASEYGEAGGIAAIVNNATVQNCAYIGTVTSYCSGGIAGLISDGGNVISCYQNGAVTGEAYAGGLIGLSMEGETVVQNCYHGEGLITGEMSGGLIGSANTSASIVNSYYLKTTSDGSVNSATYNGATAVNETVMSVLATTLEIPFVDNNDADYNYGYPIFTWQASAASETILGDINFDSKVSIVDAVILQRYLLGNYIMSQKQGLAADMNNDDYVDAFDLVFLKRMLLTKMEG